MNRPMGIKDMRKLLKERLKPGRYEHSRGVEETSAELAGRFGVDEERARIAGLLHDCAREFPNEALPLEAERRGIPIGTTEHAMPLLLHAYIGARLAGELYGVDDDGICQAIWRHTVGGAGMTKLDKIVYYADMIEPGRDYPEVAHLRRLAKEASLDDMLLSGLSASIQFVVQKGHLVHPDTVTARNEILLRKLAERKRL